MNPYQSAIRKKKFEGLKIEITPVSKDEERQAANNGDGAPMVHDDPAMEHEEMQAQATPMASEEKGEIPDDEAMEYAHNAEATPDIKDMSAEEVFGQSAPQGKPKTLRERMLKGMKGKR